MWESLGILCSVLSILEGQRRSHLIKSQALAEVRSEAVGGCLAPILAHTHLLISLSFPATKASAVMRETFCICAAHVVTFHCPWLLSLGKVAKCTKELKFPLCSL